MRARSPIAACTTFRIVGHRRQHPVHGVRQHGRHLGDRRCVHAQSVDRREALYGEFLINAQGEDVVAGIRTPQDITEHARKESGSDKASMEVAMPDAFKELTRIYTQLEKHYRDMQDMEFTVEQGKLWMLQTRNGKRTAKARCASRSTSPMKA
jgi:phosphoenolpyruvate synthase/pyruvate phosphate dikinase